MFLKILKDKKKCYDDPNFLKYYRISSNAVAFKKVSGKPIDQIPLTEDIIFGLGKALGKLHKLSNEHKPVNNIRRDWKEIIDWMKDILSNFPYETAAKNELYVLKDYFLNSLLQKRILILFIMTLKLTMCFLMMQYIIGMHWILKYQ